MELDSDNSIYELSRSAQRILGMLVAGSHPPPPASGFPSPAPEPPGDEEDQGQPAEIDQPIQDHDSGSKRRSRLALLTTVTEERAIAAPPIMGLSSRPVKG